MRKTLVTKLLTHGALAALLVGSFAFTTQITAQAAAANGPIYWPQTPGGLKATNADGSAATPPNALRNLFSAPVFNPAATKAAWVQQGMTAEIKVADADGANAITVASGNALRTPQFSADGTQLYVLQSDGRGTSTLYSISPNTANQTLAGNEILNYSGNIMSFAVSTSDKIAFIASTACAGGNLYGVVARDLAASGSGTLIADSCSTTTNTSTSPGNLVWNADGTKMFVSRVTFDQLTSTRSDLVIDEFTTSGRVGQTPFYSHPGTDKDIYAMALSPDGAQLAFYVVDRPSSGQETSEGLYAMPIATKVATKLTTPSSSVLSLSWSPVIASTAPSTTAAPTTTAAPATTAAPDSTTTTTTVATNVFTNAVPGVTKTDTKVYTQAPAKVAADSAINVLTAAQNKVMDVETKTPAVCLPNDDELVFIDEGRCIAQVVNAKTRKVLRTLRTTVVGDDISELQVGNEIVTLAPIYFDVMSSKLDAKAMARVKSLKARVSAAGSVLLVGHSGTLNGNSPENIAISKARATATLTALRSIGAKGPFAVSGVGALDPVNNGKTQTDQAKNRRVIIVLIP